jgi:uncharacterized alpha-E superfamily protein
MLSRVADAFFWVSRYVERAENVARFVDVSQSLSLGGSPQWAPLVYASGDDMLFAEHYQEFTAPNVLRFLLIDERNPNSILSCLLKARENARTIREILSVSFWEAINRFYLLVRDAARGAEPVLQNPAALLERVKRFSHEVIGVGEATMSHDEAWSFSRCGRLIERADKTSRILDVKYFILLPRPDGVGSALDVLQWSALLESTSALHMYRKRFGIIAPKRVAEFLIFEPTFPRSMYFCVTEMMHTLRKITRDLPKGHSGEVQLLTDALHERLATGTIDQVIRFGMHEFVDDFQGCLNAIGEAIRHDFFDGRRWRLVGAQQ